MCFLVQAVKLEAGAGRQKMASVSEVDRMAVFLTTAQHSLDLLRAENQKAFNYEVRLKEFNATASQVNVHYFWGFKSIKNI